ncbi:MAG: diguanylate cyclase [Rhodoferax sp.]|nr:diguanylate cyclase [Rhodoferax sp.]OIP21610.1 MAG: hypothetical protein AUK52_08060 [Comamonadaceae bacterium CG2_30_60_41]PIW07417.1 MAG: hypothetical protein COW39_13440 [Comamonadaceae bacterium CG17_big_fil_post_rev_8_21_14_2_50_60_13]PIY23166.1 MAG: hypothetical protein COZ10_09770 [Comamonadaceae bacterium CG_4_10_14_3_um_filter_60_75]PJC13530.1 MAG: hypothetical protein CO066_07690 [Comamonadaceae bacterium CG_4_9_14_0_8_um_filter_60_18]
MIRRTLQHLIGGSLQRQMTLGVVLTILLLMSYFVWDHDRYQRTQAIEDETRHVLAMARSLAVSTASGLAVKDRAALAEMVKSVSAYRDFDFAMVLDAQGQVLARSDPKNLGSYRTGLPTVLEPALLQADATLIDAVSPVIFNGQQLGWVRVGTSGQSLQAYLTQISTNSVRHLLFVLAVSVVFASLGSRYVARRLHAISKVARNIEAGDTHLRVTVQGTDEAAQLAHHFNAMLDAIASRDAALKVSEAFKSAILNSVAAEVAVLDNQGVILAVNDQWQQFAQNSTAASSPTVRATGVGVNYLQACRDASASGDNEARAALDGIMVVLQGRGPSFSLDYPCHSPEQQRWFTLVARPFGSEADRRVVITHTDITATKLAEQYEHFRGQILELMAGNTDVQDLLLAIVQGVEQLHPAMLCSVLLLTDDGKRIGRSIAPSLPAFYNLAIEGMEIGPGQGSCGTAAYTGERVVVGDIATHPFWVKFKDIAARAGLAACWSQPIFSTDATVLGTFAIYHRYVHTPSDADIELIQQTARLATIAIAYKQTQTALRASENVFRTLFETSPVGVIYHDPEGRITAANPAAQRILGLSLDQLQGRTSMDPRWHAIHEDGSDFPGDQHPIFLALRTGQPQFNVVMGVAVPERDDVWILVSATPLLENGKVVQAYATFEDITDRHLMQQKIRQLAFYDLLTQLPNRRLLIERLSHTLTTIKRSGALGALVFLDLDNFKPLNDTHGHQTGDLLLVEVARRIKTCLREEDTVARIGGDEFVVMLTDLQSEPTAARIHACNLAEKICASLAQPYVLSITQANGDICMIEHRCTASMGLTLFSAVDADQEQILRRADAAMYQAKEQGRNRVVFSAT